jgi:thiol-disulfide isomerase/thioredoxin
MKKIILISFIAIVFAVTVFNAFSDKSDSKVAVYNISQVVPGKNNSIPDFKFEKDGKFISFKEFVKGKVVFINFWGTWCPPCRREIPDIIEINKELSGKDFIVVGIAMERAADPISQVQSFAQKNGINYINFINIPELSEAYGGIPAVPTTFIVDKSGNIAEKIVGMRDKAGFMQSINRVLK